MPHKCIVNELADYDDQMNHKSNSNEQFNVFETICIESNEKQTDEKMSTQRKMKQMLDTTTRLTKTQTQ